MPPPFPPNRPTSAFSVAFASTPAAAWLATTTSAGEEAENSTTAAAGVVAAAPAIAFVLSKPAPSSRPSVSDNDAAYLRDVARRTWKYFETYITPEDRWLPPDNVQFDPEARVAHRTSPTNIAGAECWCSTQRRWSWRGSSSAPK